MYLVAQFTQSETEQRTRIGRQAVDVGAGHPGSGPKPLTWIRASVSFPKKLLEMTMALTSRFRSP